MINYRISELEGPSQRPCRATPLFNKQGQQAEKSEVLDVASWWQGQDKIAGLLIPSPVKFSNFSEGLALLSPMLLTPTTYFTQVKEK